jgi:hypothetical protein
MLWVPQKRKLLRESNLGSVGVVAMGTAVTTHATVASTKGTPVSSSASTSFDAYWVRISARGYASSGVSSACAVDILAGAATEEVIIPNLLAGFCGSLAGRRRQGQNVGLPALHPSRHEAVCAGCGRARQHSLQIGIQLFGGDGSPPWRPAGKVTTYGMGTAPDGTAITPGVSNAEGSWTQITASTSEDHFGFVPSFQMTATTSAVRALSLDIGAGAATEVRDRRPVRLRHRRH